MAINPTNAAQAYLNTVRNSASGSGMAPRTSDPGGDFAAMVKNATESVGDAAKTSEATSLQAIAGNADLNEVVAAVTNAEVALQTVLAVRERVIQAYQDIIRMPI